MRRWRKLHSTLYLIQPIEENYEYAYGDRSLQDMPVSHGIRKPNSWHRVGIDLPAIMIS